MSFCCKFRSIRSFVLDILAFKYITADINMRSDGGMGLHEKHFSEFAIKLE